MPVVTSILLQIESCSHCQRVRNNFSLYFVKYSPYRVPQLKDVNLNEIYILRNIKCLCTKSFLRKSVTSIRASYQISDHYEPNLNSIYSVYCRPPNTKFRRYPVSRFGDVTCRWPDRHCSHLRAHFMQRKCKYLARYQPPTQMTR
jgi:hypothetical protein